MRRVFGGVVAIVGVLFLSGFNPPLSAQCPASFVNPPAPPPPPPPPVTIPSAPSPAPAPAPTPPPPGGTKPPTAGGGSTTPAPTAGPAGGGSNTSPATTPGSSTSGPAGGGTPVAAGATPNAPGNGPAGGGGPGVGGGTTPSGNGSYTPAGGSAGGNNGYRGPRGGRPTAAGGPNGAAEGGATSPPTPRRGTTPSTRPALPAGSGRGPAGARPKGERQPWVEAIRAPWQPLFLSGTAPGYGTALPELEDFGNRGVIPAAVSPQPTIVLVYDPKNESDLRALHLLEDDDRFRFGSQAFRCFRLDASPFRAAMAIAVFDHEGHCVGAAPGDKLRAVVPLLDRAYERATGRELARDFPRLTETASGLAYCRHHIAELEAHLVCRDCGATHDAVVESLAALKSREREYSSVLAAFASR